MTRFATRFRRVARSLSRVELMRSSMDERFPADDLELLDRDAGRRFLDFYGDEGLRLAFDRYGLTPVLQERGWDETRLTTTAVDDRHTLLVDGRLADGAAGDGPSGDGAARDNGDGAAADGAARPAVTDDDWARLIELVVRRDRLVIEGLEAAYDVLTVDWLLLQNPGAPFRDSRVRLPGQQHPGLGVGERVLEMLYRIVERLGLDGLLTTAEHFHTAVVYARELKYVDPRYEGQLKALEGLLLDDEALSLARASWALAWGYVLDVDDSVVKWRGEAMVRARDPELVRYVTSKVHGAQAARHARDCRYRLHRDAFEERWAKEAPRLLVSPPELEP